MFIKFHSKFKKAVKKQPHKIKVKFKQKLELFRVEPFHYSLNNHALSGKLSGTRSFDITGDVRVHYEEIKDGIVLMDIGSHSQLYG